tara:strand:+ start:2373 stop:2528 length:156 start_codon:yes stop_codon:yes gene_type:complete
LIVTIIEETIHLSSVISKNANYITGENIIVSGGSTIRLILRQIAKKDKFKK